MGFNGLISAVIVVAALLKLLADVGVCFFPFPFFESGVLGARTSAGCEGVVLGAALLTRVATMPLGDDTATASGLGVLMAGAGLTSVGGGGGLDARVLLEVARRGSYLYGTGLVTTAVGLGTFAAGPPTGGLD